MSPNDTSKPSFNSGRRWTGALNMVAATMAALALAVMVNYMAAGHILRFQWSNHAGFKLSRQTLAVLDSLTNKVEVTIFFQPNGRNQEIYGLTSGLLNEYQNAKPNHIRVNLLDYTRFPVDARELLTKYALNGAQETDFVIFESNGHKKIVYARELAGYDINEIISGRIRRSSFKGELLFTSDIYAVSNPQALKTYFLYGHGEHNPGDPAGGQENLGHSGYSKLAGILKKEIDSDWDLLSLRGTNEVPRDCQLLIVAGPREGEFLPEETNKIAAYLKSGGRLMALLSQPCGLEPVLQPWGVTFGNGRVVETDPDFMVSSGSFRTAVLFPHPIINPLAKDRTPIQMWWARPLYPAVHAKVPGAPEVSFLAATSSNAVNETKRAGTYYLLAAIEQGVIKGVDTPNGGGTRIVVAGDSDFLDDECIAWLPNHDFAFLALSWLLQRPPILLEGLVPQPIKEYRLYLTTTQSANVRWLFLAGMPAAILALGGLVWLRRRR
jgi:ABC-type uncharacterized transport system involved in gliding motility auxiliary subunit